MERNNICEFIASYGIKYSNKGFKYLVEAIEMAMESPNMEFKITWIYNTIAEKFGTNANSVERAIRHELIRTKMNMHNKEFIAMAAYKLGVK